MWLFVWSWSRLLTWSVNTFLQQKHVYHISVRTSCSSVSLGRSGRGCQCMAFSQDGSASWNVSLSRFSIFPFKSVCWRFLCVNFRGLHSTLPSHHDFAIKSSKNGNETKPADSSDSWLWLSLSHSLICAALGAPHNQLWSKHQTSIFRIIINIYHVYLSTRETSAQAPEILNP